MLNAYLTLINLLCQPLPMLSFEAKSPLIHLALMKDISFLLSVTSSYTRKRTQTSINWEQGKEPKEPGLISIFHN